MSQLPLKALSVFETVSRSSSFRHAADELCVSQSAISHQIRNLEEWIGRPLFSRSGRQPQLLPHGEVLASVLQKSFQEMDAACQLTRYREEAQELVIAAIPSVAVCWLIPHLSDFHARHPKLATRVIYAFHGKDIDFKEVDLAFVFSKHLPDAPDIRAYQFQPSASVPVCSPGLRDSMDMTSLVDTLLGTTLLHDSNVDGWTDWFVQAGLNQVPSNTGPVFEDFNLLRMAALAGQGVALCPLGLIRADLNANRLVQLSSIEVNQNSHYYLIRRNDPAPDKNVARECFMSWVYETLERESEQ